MKTCNKCLTLNGVHQLYCPVCKTLLGGTDHLNQHQMTTHKTGRERTQPSKVYTSIAKSFISI